jgi:hypothetical protein
VSLRDRIALRLLWQRHAWKFNWAHKPLCEHFHGEILRIGALHVCRSCTFLYMGMIAAGAAGILRPGLIADRPFLFAGILAAVAVFSAPPFYKRWPRLVRDLLRLGAGALIPACFIVLSAGNAILGATGLLLLWIHWRVYLRHRRKRRARVCDDCPDLAAGAICPGFRPQAEAARAYERAASARAMAAFRPNHHRSRS